MAPNTRKMEVFNPQLQQAIQMHQSGRFAEAEVQYKMILEKENADINIYGNLADTLQQQGKLDETISTLEQAIRKHPNHPQLKLILVNTFLMVGLLDQAKQMVLALKKDQPQMPEVHYAHGSILLQENDLEGAIKSFEEALARNPQFVEAWYNLGTLAYQNGDLKTAIEKWEKAISIQPQLVPALLNLAKVEVDQGKYESAIVRLEQILSLAPTHEQAVQLYGMSKHATGDLETALKQYQKLERAEGTPIEVLVLLGNAMRDLNRIADAEKYYLQVLEQEAEHPIAKENLEKIHGNRIEAWHFKMLADLKRNEAYDQCIKNVVQEGDTVLDIGTGSGLLSMMSVRAGASKVYSCESIVDIANAAKDVIRDNGYADQIQVFRSLSIGLKLGEDIPEKVDVLVSEILDAGLLGEGVIPSVRHATSNFLKEGGKIIPAAATVQAAFIQSESIRAVSPLKEISGFDLSSFGRFQQSRGYHSNDLAVIPHVVLSEVTPIIDIDFYHLPKVAHSDAPNVSVIELPIVEDGEIHAVAFWFDLHLDDQLSLSSGPQGEMFHWGQATYCFPELRTVKKGDSIRLKVMQIEDRLMFEYA